ncbi:MAG TPA: hypothetical protein VGC64_03355, partial [Pyrinomonadaceae bacterium]
MKKLKCLRAVRWFSLLLLLLSLCSSQLMLERASAQSGFGLKGLNLPVVGENKVSPDLLERARNWWTREKRTRVILQLNDQAGATIDSLLQTAGGRVTSRFQQFNSRALELPAKVVEWLATRSEVRFISLDRESVPAGHVSLTTGADMVRNAGYAPPP